MGQTSIRGEQIRNETIKVEDLKDFAVIVDSGLNVTVLAGRIRNDNVITDKNTQSVGLTDNTTNYVEINNSGVASANTSGFTSGSIPLATVITASGSVSSITDKRAWAIIDNAIIDNDDRALFAQFLLMGA